MAGAKDRNYSRDKSEANSYGEDEIPWGTRSATPYHQYAPRPERGQKSGPGQNSRQSVETFSNDSQASVSNRKEKNSGQSESRQQMTPSVQKFFQSVPGKAIQGGQSFSAPFLAPDQPQGPYPWQQYPPPTYHNQTPDIPDTPQVAQVAQANSVSGVYPFPYTLNGQPNMYQKGHDVHYNEHQFPSGQNINQVNQIAHTGPGQMPVQGNPYHFPTASGGVTAQYPGVSPGSINANGSNAGNNTTTYPCTRDTGFVPDKILLNYILAWAYQCSEYFIPLDGFEYAISECIERHGWLLQQRDLGAFKKVADEMIVNLANQHCSNFSSRQVDFPRDLDAWGSFKYIRDKFGRATDVASLPNKSSSNTEPTFWTDYFKMSICRLHEKMKSKTGDTSTEGGVFPSHSISNTSRLPPLANDNNGVSFFYYPTGASPTINSTNVNHQMHPPNANFHKTSNAVDTMSKPCAVSTEYLPKVPEAVSYQQSIPPYSQGGQQDAYAGNKSMDPQAYSCFGQAIESIPGNKWEQSSANVDLSITDKKWEQHFENDGKGIAAGKWGQGSANAGQGIGANKWEQSPGHSIKWEQSSGNSIQWEKSSGNFYKCEQNSGNSYKSEQSSDTGQGSVDSKWCQGSINAGHGSMGDKWGQGSANVGQGIADSEWERISDFVDQIVTDDNWQQSSGNAGHGIAASKWEQNSGNASQGIAGSKWEHNSGNAGQGIAGSKWEQNSGNAGQGIAASKWEQNSGNAGQGIAGSKWEHNSGNAGQGIAASKWEHNSGNAGQDKENKPQGAATAADGQSQSYSSHAHSSGKTQDRPLQIVKSQDCSEPCRCKQVGDFNTMYIQPSGDVVDSRRSPSGSRRVIYKQSTGYSVIYERNKTGYVDFFIRQPSGYTDIISTDPNGETNIFYKRVDQDMKDFCTMHPSRLNPEHKEFLDTYSDRFTGFSYTKF